MSLSLFAFVTMIANGGSSASLKEIKVIEILMCRSNFCSSFPKHEMYVTHTPSNFLYTATAFYDVENLVFQFILPPVSETDRYQRRFDKYKNSSTESEIESPLIRDADWSIQIFF